MNILIVCILGFMALALLVSLSVLWWASDISSLAKKNLNRVQSGYRWTSQDMVDNHCRREAADLTLRISVVFWVILVVAALTYFVVLCLRNNVPLIY